jgi:predicted phosphodiesterase
MHKRAIAAVEYADNEGDHAAELKYGISHETLRRYRRLVKNDGADSDVGDDFDARTETLLRQIGEKLTKKELEAIAKSGTFDRTERAISADWFDGDQLKVGVITDTHIGSKSFREDWFDGAVDRFLAADVDVVLHVGDISEGMSNRPGHIYELTHLGYSEQLDACVEQMGKLADFPVYAIDGNHDRWFVKSNGAKIVPAVCDALDNMTFLGHDTGTLEIGGIRIQLWHGEDGASYAHSYRLQKVIEALPGGKKPHVLVSGHVHKSGYFFERNVHAFLSGCIQEQTPWMRSKRLPAHPGFWILDMDINAGSVVRMSPTFFPYYY